MYCSLQNLFHILSVFYSTNFVGVIIPGYNVKPESYSGLASSIVSTMEESNIGMDVYTANVTYPTQENYNTALDSIFNYVHRVYNNVSIVAITHSAGMYFGEEYAVGQSFLQQEPATLTRAKGDRARPLIQKISSCSTLFNFFLCSGLNFFQHSGDCE